MKTYQTWITPICILLLFSTCRKEIRLQDQAPGISKYNLDANGTSLYEWRFDTNNNLEGWTAGNASAAVSGGALNLTTTSVDPLIISPDNLAIASPATYKYIRVNMKNNSPVTGARIFFMTNSDPTWTSAKSKGFTIAAHNTYYASYIVDMSTVAGWTGTIKQIRIDPLDPATGSGQTVSIDYIGISGIVTNVSEWLFDAEGDAEGWTWGNATAAVSGGTFNLTTTSVDPLMMSPDNLGITAPATYKFVHVDMRNYSTDTRDTSARIFFITDTDTTWNSTKSKRFTIKADTGYYGSYIVDMSTVAGWTGTIRRIRVDPLDPASASGRSVKIDFIRITDNQSFRGVMSPQGDLLAGDADTLKNIWRANVMRWQIMSPNNYPATVDDYHTWLDNEMAQLDNAFALCEPLGIKLLIDMHYPPLGGNNTNGTMVFFNSAANDTLVASWKRLATRYKDRTGLYGYDLINEPIQKTTPAANCDYRTTMIKIGNAIRTIDRKTPLFIAAPVGDFPSGFNNLTPFPLTNVVYETHMYVPLEYTHQHIGDDTISYTYPGMTIGSKTYNKTQLITELSSVRNFQNNYSARIFVGEFSAARWAGGAATYLRDCIDIFESYGWSWTYHVFRESPVWSLEYQNRRDSTLRATTPTDRYNQVVGWGLSLNR